ncbi:MAG: hypothetical protein ACRD2C_13855, partial [Acidimicrobiales bacterium]
MANIEDLTGFFSDFFVNEESQQAFQENPEGFLNQNGLTNVSAFEVETAANRVLAPDQSVNIGGGGGGGGFAHPLPEREALSVAPDEGGLQGAIDAISHYQTTYHTLVENENFDLSTNNNITAFGDVELDQDIDQNLATGDGAVAGEFDGD